MNDLRLWANYYYNMGFNVTYIIPEQNSGKAKNIYKSPTNDRYKIANMRQSFEEMRSFDYENSSGIGTVLGFNNLRALDFDGHETTEKNFNNFIERCLRLLNLPSSYEWVVRTPNNGFHIIIYAPNHRFPIDDNMTKAFTPNVNTYSNYGKGDNYVLKHIELRWNKHLVLPPSRNKDGKIYEFYSTKIPISLPKEINNDNLKDLLDELCFDKDEDETNLLGSYNQFYGWLFELTEQNRIYKERLFDKYHNDYY